MFFKKLPIVFFLLISSITTMAQYISPFSGIWIYHVTDLGRTQNGCIKLFDKKAYDYPGLKGVMLNFSWKKIQPSAPTDSLSDYFNTGGFNWNFLDSELIDVASHNLYIGILIWTGEDAPDWLYQAPYNIGTCYTNGENACQAIVPKKFPDYYNSYYQQLWRNMTDSVIKHLNQGPDIDKGNTVDYRNSIAFYQSCQGATGDLDPQKGALINGSPEYCFIEKENWFSEIVKPAWKYTDTLISQYKSNLPNIHLLVNNDDANSFTSKDLDSGIVFSSQEEFTEPDRLFRFATDSLYNAWRKGSGSGHYYELNYEKYFRNAYATLNNKQGTDNDPVLLRDECDLHNINIPGATESYNFYSIATNALFNGIDMWMINYDLLYMNDSISDPADTATADDVINPANLWITSFFNKNVTSNPYAATNAFCALRDGLDAGDFERFPASDFSDTCVATSLYQKPKRALANNDPLNLNCGSQRTLNIQLNKFANGALQQDAPAAQGKPIRQRNTAIGVNDVGWYINEGNHERFLSQINIVNSLTESDSTNSTSVGYWNKIYPDINTNDTDYNNQIFGRFSRGFDLAKNKKALYFNIHDSFITTQPKCRLSLTTSFSYSGRVNITYLDSGYGKWTLFYDGINKDGLPEIKRSVPVVCKNTNRWITRSFVIPCNARFANGAAEGSDFYIRNSGKENVLFALVTFEKLFSRPTASPSFQSVTANRLIISPNPVTNIFQIKAKEKNLLRQVYIYRQDGIKIFSITVNNYTAKLSKGQANLHTGIYFIKVLMQDNSFITEKIMVP